MKTLKPGGNFTQPVDEPGSGELHFDVYVRWQRVARFQTDADAVEALKRLLDGELVELHPDPTGHA